MRNSRRIRWSAAAVLLAGALAVVIFGVPTRGLALEEISVAHEPEESEAAPLSTRRSQA